MVGGVREGDLVDVLTEGVHPTPVARVDEVYANGTCLAWLQAPHQGAIQFDPDNVILEESGLSIEAACTTKVVFVVATW